MDLAMVRRLSPWYDKFCGVEFRVMGASDRALGLKVSATSASGFRV